MAKSVLCMLDTVGIQDYIFRTNELKQIVGASFLVNCATRDWIGETLDILRIAHNLNDLENPDTRISTEKIEDEGKRAEIFLAGGGNAVIAFTDEQDALDFIYTLSKRVLTEAPGLALAISRIPFDFCKDALGGKNGVLAQLSSQMDHAKMQLPRSQPQPGLAVTLQCDFTHLPAVAITSDQEHQPVSAEVQAKLEFADKADRRLHRLLAKVPEEKWREAGMDQKDFARRLDDLGSSAGDKSLLAVVHIDGNGMGKRFRAIADRYPLPEQNRALILEQRALSFSIQKNSEATLVEMVEYLLGRIHPDKDGIPCLDGWVPLESRLLPLRPILYGGDDVTFLCDGRIGLSAAACYVESASRTPLVDGKRLFSRAGVAIVKTHYPFSRAYQLAEQLVQSAKSFIGETQAELQKNGRFNDVVDGINALDWHLTTSGLVRDLRTARDTEYFCDEGNLLIRPVFLGKLPGSSDSSNTIPEEWRSWQTFLEIFAGFDKWRDSHNKIKELRSTLIRGKDAVQVFVEINGKLLPFVPGLDKQVMSNGWDGNRCPYFDAVEMIDLLSEEEEVSDAQV